MSKNFSFFHQPDAMDCGATCLAMIAKHYGKTTSENHLPNGTVYVADPGHGLIQFTVQEFCNNRLSTKKDGQEKGVALLLEPTPGFYEQEGEK